jgi:hypothetical protein
MRTVRRGLRRIQDRILTGAALTPPRSRFDITVSSADTDTRIVISPMLAPPLRR